jgi:release factor glutamine methyltransferase
VTTQERWTIGRLLDWTTKFLAEKGSESPRLDTEVLLAHALGCKRIELYTRHDEEPAEPNRTKFRELIRQRVEGCPVAYLVGRKEFFSLQFEVNRAVLIPRPDSECVVDECLRLAKALREPRVLDIGTGSGNLAIAVARHHKTAQVTAVEISPEALAVAQRNSATHGVADRVRFLQGDLFEPLSPEDRFDFVLSNPPYIPHDDIAKLEPGVRDYEPHTALNGGKDGFAVFDRLVLEAPRFLHPGGCLIVEIGAPQEQHARQRIETHGSYELAKTVYDGSGHPRVLKARLRPGQ